MRHLISVVCVLAWVVRCLLIGAFVLVQTLPVYARAQDWGETRWSVWNAKRSSQIRRLRRPRLSRRASRRQCWWLLLGRVSPSEWQ